MSWWEALILGLVQGLTEFLPVSSSGHLEIGQALLGTAGEENLTFAIVVHTATVLSTLVILWKEVAQLFKGTFTTTKWNEEKNYVSMILVSMIPVFIVGMFFPKAAAGIFTHDPQLIDLSAKAMRTMTLVFPIVGFQMIATNFFQSLGMVKKSIILSLSRQLLFLLPMLYILPLYIGADGVWTSFPIADGVSTLVTIFMLGRLFKKFSMLKDGDDPSVLGSQI